MIDAIVVASRSAISSADQPRPSRNISTALARRQPGDGGQDRELDALLRFDGFVRARSGQLAPGLDQRLLDRILSVVPATPIIDAGRSIMIGAAAWGEIATAALVLIALGVATYTLAGQRLRRLLRADGG